MRPTTQRSVFVVAVVGGATVFVAPAALGAGSIFLTGHDPDFHAYVGITFDFGNGPGAVRINQAAISFIQDPGFNPFVGAAPKFLFVESSLSPPGHVDGELGIVLSGYTAGVNYDKADASTLNGALNLLGVPGGYSAIVVASDFGGILSQAELDILNARQADIGSFINAGGGLYAMAEGNNGTHLTPNGGWFEFVPGLLTSTAFNQTEFGITVTPFGASLGLTNDDVNGNASHNIFLNIGGLSPVDIDSQGNFLSVAGRINVPAPGAAGLLALVGLAAVRRRR